MTYKPQKFLTYLEAGKSKIKTLTEFMPASRLLDYHFLLFSHIEERARELSGFTLMRKLISFIRTSLMT